MCGMSSDLGELALRGGHGGLEALAHPPARGRSRSWSRRALPTVVVAALAVGVAGCGAGDYASTSLTTLVAAPAQPTAVTPKARPTATTRPTAATASTLGTLPPVLSRTPSPIDSAVITSLADVPAAFGCPKTPTPIVIPATRDSPAAVVCRGTYVNEALFLWYAADADARYLAIKAAMAKARYVHAGRSWVAGGMVDKTMGTVGGEVFK